MSNNILNMYKYHSYYIFPNNITKSTTSELYSIGLAEQNFSDCYLISTLDSLSRSTNGRKILEEQIQWEVDRSDVINCYLYNKSGVKEKYVIPTQQPLKGYESLYEHQANDIVRSLDISVAQYEEKHKSKPIFCRIANKFGHFNFEFNLASHFMEIFTGVKPTINIAEKSLNLNLKPYKNDVLELLKKIDQNKDFSIIIGSGIKKVDGRRFHVYVLEDVNLSENKVTIKNKRGNEVKTYTVQEILDKFKYIVGYFNKDLVKPPL